MTTQPKLVHLEDRGVVSVTGPDAVKFLQGLLTNDIEPLHTEPDALAFDAAAAHAALLSPQGKILFEFFCVRTLDGYVLEVAREKAAELAKRLVMYKLRAAVEIKDASEAYMLLALWGQNACSSGPTVGTIAFKDPRHAGLGHRIMAEARFATDIASATNGTKISADHYHAHRIALGVPEGGKDFAFGDTFPHEACMDQLNGISFTKGCYVGQEIVARMEHRGTARKRVVPVIGTSALPASGTEIKAGDVAIGTLGSIAGNRGLAMIRLDRAAEFKDKGVALTAGEVAVSIEKPTWAKFDLDPRKANDPL